MKAFLLLCALLATSYGMPILLERDYFGHDYHSVTYPPQKIIHGFQGFIRYIFSKMDQGAVLEILKTDRAVSCFMDYQFNNLSIAPYDWEECRDVMNFHLHMNWNRFVNGMPKEAKNSFQEVHDFMIDQRLKLDKMNENEAYLVVREYLKAVKKILILPDADLKLLAKTYPDLERVFTGDLHEPLIHLVDALLTLPTSEDFENFRIMNLFHSIPSVFNTYKNGLKVLVPAKAKFMEFAEKEEEYEKKMDKVARFLYDIVPTAEFTQKVGGLFDLVDAYDVLCNQPIVWYNVPKHVEKYVTC